MKGPQDKVALVTGGSSGTGQAIAIRLGEEGATVAINYVGRPEGAITTQEAIEHGVERRMVEEHVPMRRAGGAEEMAAAVAFLCSDEAAYITGQTLFIDGGLRVAVVERELAGGECSYWGCIPSKTLLRPGDVLASARRAPGAAVPRG